MIAEYKCVTKCFFNNSLHEVGVVVVADEKDMKGNHCFKRLPSKKSGQDERTEETGKVTE